MSVILVGLGIALVAAGIAVPAFLNFTARLPLDAQATTWTVEDDSGTAQTLSEEGTDTYEGPLTYQLHLDVQDPSGAEDAQLRIGETTFRGTADDGEDVNNLVNAKIWTYGIDRLSGEAVTEANIAHTLATPAATTPVDGYWLKFPAQAEKTNYPVFDPYLRSAVDAVFEEEMDIEGRTVYRYHQDIEPTNVATKYADPFNTTQIDTEEGGTDTGYLFHSGSRDYYVDQATGMLVGMDINVDDYYGTRDGERVRDAFVFNGSTSEEDRSEFLAQAADMPAPGVGNLVTWILIGVGALLALVGLAGVFGLFGHRRT